MPSLVLLSLLTMTQQVSAVDLSQRGHRSSAQPATIAVNADTTRLPLTLTVDCQCTSTAGLSNATTRTVLFVVVDGRHVRQQANPCGRTELVLSEVGCGAHTVASYLHHAVPSDMYVHTEVLSIVDVNLPCDGTQIPDVTADGHRVGVYYSTYNGLLRGNGTTVAVEDVLRNRSRSLSDAAPGFWQHEPKIGFYCLYRKRVGEVGIVPDCPDIEKTLASHASTLISAGVDYITLDGTNWGPWPSDAADVTQLRPTEVICEEFYRLRLAGRSTPQISVWNRVDVAAPNDPEGGAGDTLWQQYLDRIYNNASYEDLILKSRDGRKVFFVVWFPWAINQTAVDAIESNGGRHDIVVVHNWLSPFGYDPEWYNNGTWTFLAPCVAAAPRAVGLNTEQPYPRFTTSINEDTPCNHLRTTNSPIGNAWTVSTSTAWSNLPFASSGKLGGLFLRKQFEDVFQDNNYSHIFLPSFNEFAVTPVPWGANMGINNSHLRGMGSGKDDVMRYDWFIDGYASERSRTIEPSTADDGFYLRLMASCLRVARLLSTELIAPDPGGGRCSVGGEICCEVPVRQSFVSVWSFAHKNGHRRVLSNALAEAATLQSSGKWRQRCNAFGGQLGSQSGPTDFCVNTSLLFTQDREVNSGPFLLFQNGSMQYTTPLFQCSYTNQRTNKHVFVDAPTFVSLDRGCEQQGVLRGPGALGFVSTVPNSLTPRTLHRCCTTGIHSDDSSVSSAYSVRHHGAGTARMARCDHVLDAECESSEESKLMGYVV